MRRSASYDLINSTAKREDVRFSAYCCGSVIGSLHRQWLLLCLRVKDIYIPQAAAAQNKARERRQAPEVGNEQARAAAS